MASSDVTICSNALLELGDAPISSFDEGGDPTNIKRARLVANLWPQVRDSVLRSKHWNSCKKRVRLAPEAGAPEYGYTAKFLKPADWLRTVSVGNERENWPYRDEGGRILCNATVLPLTYIFRNTNAATYDSMLVDVLTQAMALRLAYPITKSAALVKERRDMLREAMMRAGAVDGQDDGPEELGSFDLLGARFGGGAISA
ncbi:MAG: hypothetical protein ACRCV9_17945 [Burkholderiaceae bacterium]